LRRRVANGRRGAGRGGGVGGGIAIVGGGVGRGGESAAAVDVVVLVM